MRWIPLGLVICFSLAMTSAPDNARAQGAASEATQGEITMLAAGGMTAAAEQLIPVFESRTVYTVKATYGSGMRTKQQIARGDAYDVAILQPPYPDVLASGNVVAASATTLARIVLGVAVRKGAPKPDISTQRAVVNLLLEAHGIAYPDPAAGSASGTHVEEMLRKVGLATLLQPKLKRGMGSAGAMALVAHGNAEIGLCWLSEMLDPGVDVVGPLPSVVGASEDMVGLVGSRAKNPVAAKALIDFLASPEAAAVYRARRMEPDRH